MTALEPLADVVAALDGAGVPYMVVGSTASSLHGVPRATQDIDIVVDPTSRSLARLVQALGARYYVPVDAAERALREHEMFNVVDTTTGWKWVVVYVASPEDTILSELEWAKDSRSERQLEDVSNLLALRADDLDNVYMDEWATRLGIADLLERARSGLDE